MSSNVSTVYKWRDETAGKPRQIIGSLIVKVSQSAVLPRLVQL